MTDWHADIPGEYRNHIVTGDARELAKRIPDESIDLIFTDPIYDQIDDYRWLAETAARVLKDGGELLTYVANYHLDKTILAFTDYLDYRWLLVEKNMESGGGMLRIWTYELNTMFSPLLWYSKGRPRKAQSKRRDYVLRLPSKLNHKWAKGITGVNRWIKYFAGATDIIFDPFTGGGTVPAVCKMLNRNFIAFEIDPDTAKLARERVLNTQPPLLFEIPKQMEIAL